MSVEKNEEVEGENSVVIKGKVAWTHDEKRKMEFKLFFSSPVILDSGNVRPECTDAFVNVSGVLYGFKWTDKRAAVRV